jgi:hypothetical protein
MAMQKCERIGCGRLSYSVEEYTINSKKIKLCKNCAVLIMVKAKVMRKEEEGIDVFTLYLVDTIDKIRDFVSGTTRKVKGVTLYFPWKDPPKDEEEEERNELDF